MGIRPRNSGVLKTWGVLGILLNHQWGIEGGPNPTKITGGQYFYAFGLGSGFQLFSGPTYGYNWDTKELTFPVRAGIAKTTFVGAMPLKLQLQGWYYVARPDAFANDWLIRIAIAPVFKVPWAK